MHRRQFLQGASASLVAGCTGTGSTEAPRTLLGRTDLVEMQGITSMHDHVDSMESAERLVQAMDRVGLARVNLCGAYLSLLHRKKALDWASGATNNALLMQVVERWPERYTAFALIDGMEANPLATLKEWLSRGAVGVKMYNGTSGAYRRMPLTDPRLAPVLAFCDLHGVPVLVHTDRKHIYELLRVVKSYASIPWIAPHLLTLTRPRDFDQLEQALRRAPNLTTEMSYGFENWMHKSLTRLSQGRDRLREICIAHADQLVFSTDIVMTGAKHRTVEWAANSLSEYRKWHERDRFHHRVADHKKVYASELEALALPDEVLQTIYVDNPRRFLDGPRVQWSGDDLGSLRIDWSPKLPVGQGPDAVVCVAATAVLSQCDSVTHPEVRWVMPQGFGDAVAAALTLDRGRCEEVETVQAAAQQAAEQLETIAVIPLSALEPRLRALPIEGVDPTWPRPQIRACARARKATRQAFFGAYPLLLPVAAGEEGSAPERFDPHALRTVLTSGTSLFGDGMVLDPPASDPQAVVAALLPWFADVDVVHLSVENLHKVPCVQDLKKWKFCFEAPWLAVLESLQVDVVELTGNHLEDWPTDVIVDTIDAYYSRGVQTFGGGEDLKSACAPATVDVRGLTIGFTGWNRVNAEPYGASEERAGPLVPREGREDNHRVVLEATRRASDVFFFGYQGSLEFSITPTNDYVRAAHLAVDGGAVATWSSHPHMPAGLEVYRGATVHYGPGNFLFRHPSTTMPKRSLTEDGLLLRHTLLGDRLLQSAQLGIRYERGRVIRPLSREEQGALRRRAAIGSRAALAPRQAVPLADSCVSIREERDYKALWRVQSRSWVRHWLVSVERKAAQELGSPNACLELLETVRSRYAHFGGGAMALAVPMLASWSPDGVSPAAFRVLDEELGSKPGRVASLCATGAVTQLVLTRRRRLHEITGWLDGVEGGRVLVSGLPMVADAREAVSDWLVAHPGVWVDTSAASHADHARWFAGLEGDPHGWAQWMMRHLGRVLLGTGTSPAKKRLGSSNHNRVLRSLHWSVQERSYRRHLIADGHRGEWGSYDYAKEPLVAGLALPEGAVEAIVSGNFTRLFGA